MNKEKSFHLFSGTDEGIHWDITVRISRKEKLRGINTFHITTLNYSAKWRRENRKKEGVKEKEYMQNKTSDCIRKTIVSGGFCWICGELNPMVFEYHHIFGKDWRKIPGKIGHLHMDEDFIALCANCHRKYRARPQEKHLTLIEKAIEKGVMFYEN